MRAILFGVPASHPVKAAELMLRHKRIAYRRIDLVTGAHRALVRALGFPAATVPAIRLDGRRLQGTREIARALDALAPEPPLLPREPGLRAAVERAQGWDDEVLQPVVRRIAWGALRRDGTGLRSFLDGAHLGLPVALAVLAAPAAALLSARLNHATDAAVQRDLAALPRLLDHVDALIAGGVIAGGARSAADYQVLSSVRLLLAFEDLRGALEHRAAASAARAVVPDFPGHAPAALPPAWLAPLRTA